MLRNNLYSNTGNRIHYRYRLLLGMLAFLLPLVTGCSHSDKGTATNSTKAPGETTKVFRIGYQKWSPLNVLRLRGDLDRQLAAQGVRVEWLDFPAGPQLLEALAAGSIDLGHTGDAPVAFALAAGHPIVYVANAPAGDDTGESRALLVPQNSPIRSVADLKGKRIAVQKGSATHSFLVQALAAAHLDYKEVQIAYLAPPDARPAFDSGSVDGWAIWDPYLAITQHTTGARTLVNGKNIVTAGAFYVSSREAVRRHPEWIQAALQGADDTGRWMTQHVQESAKLLAAPLHVDVPTMEEAVRRSQPHDGSYIGLRPVDERVLQQQQTVAETFSRIGLLPAHVDVKSGLLSAEDIARVTPAHWLKQREPNARPTSQHTAQAGEQGAAR